MFKKYLHVERYGNDEVQGIELGECHIFPKLDGTNGSIWMDDNKLCAGSRTRELTIEADNAGFYAYALSRELDFVCFFDAHPNMRLYGEWLVPHTFKKYRENAWRKFYVFDVYDDEKERFIPYGEYSQWITDAGLDLIPPLCIMKNGTYDSLLHEVKANGFLVADGAGCGEGIVIKNYGFANRFGRYAYAKIVTQEFKDKHPIAMGPTVKQMKEMVEIAICDKYLTKHLVDKTYAKITNENGGWNSKYIPRLLHTIYHDLVTEELWEAVKEHKNPTINFKTLNSVAINRTKSLLPELF